MERDPYGDDISAPPTGPLSLLKRVLHKRLALLYCLVVALVFAASQFDALVPVATKGLLNAGELMIKSEPSADQLWFRFLQLCLVYSGAVFAARGFQVAIGLAAPELRLKILDVIVAFSLGRSPAHFERVPPETMCHYTTALPRAVSTFLEILCVDVVRFVVLVIFATVTAALQNPLLAFGFGLWAVAYLTFSAMATKRAKELGARVVRATAITASEMQDAASNIATIFACSSWDFERVRLLSTLINERSAGMQFHLHSACTRIVQSLLAITCIFVVTGFTVERYSHGTASIGDVAMMFGLSTLLCTSTWQLSMRLVDLFEQLGIISTSLQALKGGDALVPRAGNAKGSATRGSIEFCEVCFSYRQGPAVLSKLNFKIEAGEWVGVAGPSGSGKSTLVRLLRRHFDPDHGTIRLDGIDLGAIGIDILSLVIADAEQAPKLFNRSVAENMMYGKRDATLAEVIAMSKRVGCHDFIMRRPGNYQTLAGVAGKNFSSGERQRIILVRVLLRDAPIVVLDEATSALDPESEAVIQRALSDLLVGRTVLQIAHRLAGLVNMNRIMWLERGRVLEIGTHQELLNLGGAYAHAWALQNAQVQRNGEAPEQEGCFRGSSNHWY